MGWGTLVFMTTTVEPTTLSPGPGTWTEDAACARLPSALTGVFVADRPDPARLALAARTCSRCTVRQECGDYAVESRAYGLWGGLWHDGKGGVGREVQQPGQAA